MALEEADGGGGDGAVAAGDAQVIEGPGFGGVADVAFDEGGEVVVIDEFLLVANFLEAGEDGLDFGVAHLDAEVLEAGGDGGAAAVLGEGQFGGAPADGLGGP